MSEAIDPKWRLEPRATGARNGIAVIWDLAEFAKFFNQADIHRYVPQYINIVLDSVERCFFGGETYWVKDGGVIKPLDQLPVQRKFMGDGALYIWHAGDECGDFSSTFRVALSNRLWNLKSFFSNVNKRALSKLPVAALPARIRFGVASGTIHELTVAGSQEKEYIGVCINLASRLQKYCPDLGFIASARLDIHNSVLKENSYKRVIATAIRGFPNEIVIVDRDEYRELSQSQKKRLFRAVRA